MRVEKLQVDHGHTDAFVDLVESHTVVHQYSVGTMHQQAGIHGIEVMLRGIVHHIGHGDESRDITTRLSGQIRPDSPIVLHATRPNDGPVDCTRTRVIGSQHEEPVLITPIKAFQISAGSIGFLVGIVAFVNESSYLQAIF